METVRTDAKNVAYLPEMRSRSITRLKLTKCHQKITPDIPEMRSRSITRLKLKYYDREPYVAVPEMRSRLITRLKLHYGAHRCPLWA